MNSNSYLIGIKYLEGSDVNPDGSLKSHVNEGKPVLLMIQGNFCGYCSQAKPAFQELSKILSNVILATIQTDAGPNDKQASLNLKSVNTSPGVPSYLGFDKNGKFVKAHQGGRDVESLQTFAMSL